jgi:hypothetical protein
VLPGLGSLWARRWISGGLQAALALGGAALATHWTLGWVRRVLSTGTIPLDPGPDFESAVAGVLLFLLGWAWSVGTGVALVRAARRRLGGLRPHATGSHHAQ